MINKCKNCGSKSKNGKCPHSINYEHDFDNINIQEEMKKMSDEELIFKISNIWLDNYSIYKRELLKRLSKNNIEQFKKRLIEEIEKSYFIPSNKEDQNIIKKLNPLFETYKNNIIDLINNIGKEK